MMKQQHQRSLHSIIRGKFITRFPRTSLRHIIWTLHSLADTFLQFSPRSCQEISELCLFIFVDTLFVSTNTCSSSFTVLQLIKWLLLLRPSSNAPLLLLLLRLSMTCLWASAVKTHATASPVFFLKLWKNKASRPSKMIKISGKANP